MLWVEMTGANIKSVQADIKEVRRSKKNHANELSAIRAVSEKRLLPLSGLKPELPDLQDELASGSNTRHTTKTQLAT